MIKANDALAKSKLNEHEIVPLNELDYIGDEITRASTYGLTRTITPLIISEEAKHELLNAGYTIAGKLQKVFDEYYLCYIDWTNVKEEI
jgi:hypothetical protein